MGANAGSNPCTRPEQIPRITESKSAQALDSDRMAFRHASRFCQ